MHVYTHIDLGIFSWKVALFMKSTWKPLKSNKKTADSTHISYYDLVFGRVQREGPLDISYILVVLGGVCGECMLKWYMYTHILTWFCWFSWKVVLFMWKLVLFVKSTWKALKTEKHLKSEKHTWKVRSTWKVKASKKWKTHEELKAHEKHMKSEKHHFSWKA